MTLVPVRWWDVAELAALEAELFDDDAWSEATWWGELARHDARSYVLRRDEAGRVEGYAGVSVQGADADVMTVAVAPDAQGRGVGRQLLDALVDLAARGGATQLLLEVRGDNVVAQRLYRSAGFVRIALRRGYYRDADGWVMRLRPLPEVTGC